MTDEEFEQSFGSPVLLIPHVPRNPLARGFWFVARTVVASWERAVDAARGRRHP